jgi:hypothetical protein
MAKHLLKNGKEIPRSKLVQVFEDANKLLENLEHIMSEDEYIFVKESINSKAIPSPKLLIKDHKEINDVPMLLSITPTLKILHLSHQTIRTKKSSSTNDSLTMPSSYNKIDHFLAAMSLFGNPGAHLEWESSGASRSDIFLDFTLKLPFP